MKQNIVNKFINPSSYVNWNSFVPISVLDTKIDYIKE